MPRGIYDRTRFKKGAIKMGRPIKNTPLRIKFVMKEFTENRTLQDSDLKKKVDEEYPVGRGMNLVRIQSCMKLVILGFEPQEMSFEDLDEEVSKLPGGSIEDITKVATLLKDGFAVSNSCQIRTMRKADKMKEELKVGVTPLTKGFCEKLKALAPDIKMLGITEVVIAWRGDNLFYKTKTMVEEEVVLN